MLQKTTDLNLKYATKLIVNPKQDYEKAINAFLTGQVGKFGKYFALPDALVFRTIITEDCGAQQRVAQEVIARNINGELIGNSSMLNLVNRRVSFGRAWNTRELPEIQKCLGNLIPMLPFGVFEEAGLSLSKLEILERGNEEEVIVKVLNPEFDKYDDDKKHLPEFLDEKRHFTGASLFRIEDKYFLFDIDREEIKHKIFNAFLVECPKAVNTISEGYQSLVPSEVLEAREKGLKVIRQGEFFYVPSDKEIKPIDSSAQYSIRAGNGRPNYADKGVEVDGVIYISGRVEHSGREHRVVKLTQWHKVVTNLAVGSFQLTGEID